MILQSQYTQLCRFLNQKRRMGRTRQRLPCKIGETRGRHSPKNSEIMKTDKITPAGGRLCGGPARARNGADANAVKRRYELRTGGETRAGGEAG
jgi:hypothetical protein